MKQSVANVYASFFIRPVQWKQIVSGRWNFHCIYCIIQAHMMEQLEVQTGWNRWLNLQHLQLNSPAEWLTEKLRVCKPSYGLQLDISWGWLWKLAKIQDICLVVGSVCIWHMPGMVKIQKTVDCKASRDQLYMVIFCVSPCTINGGYLAHIQEVLACCLICTQ